MAVSGIDYNYIHFGFNQGFDAILILDADGRANTKPAALVPNRQRILLEAVDIPHGNQARQLAFAVHQQELFDFMFLEDDLG